MRELRSCLSTVRNIQC